MCGMSEIDTQTLDRLLIKALTMLMCMVYKTIENNECVLLFKVYEGGEEV